VFYKGQSLGRTPCIARDLPTGPAEFRFVHSGYEEAVHRVNVAMDRRVEHHEVLTELRGLLEVKARGGPARPTGILRLNGDAVGTVSLPWRSGGLPEGSVQVDFELTDGDRFTASGRVENGYTNTVLLVLPDQPKPSEDWTLADLDLMMKWIGPGSFMMGSTPEERRWAADPEGGKGKAEWFTDEKNPFQVGIREGFWMGQTEVTIAQWKAFIAAERYVTDAEKKGQAWSLEDGSWGWVDGADWRRPWKGGYTIADDHPVTCISWNDAMAFCKWLTERERKQGRLPDGLEYRLPGEAEWEYACRGGREGARFWWGDSVSAGQGRANVAGTDKLPSGGVWSANWGFTDGYAWVAPVNSYGGRGLNGYGLADMLGNVWEWCLDGYDSGGPHSEPWFASRSRRVLRGGSFGGIPGGMRCAARDRNLPGNPLAFLGFRLCLGVVAPQE